MNVDMSTLGETLTMSNKGNEGILLMEKEGCVVEVKVCILAFG